MKKLITSTMAILLTGLVFANAGQSSSHVATLIGPGPMTSPKYDIATRIGGDPMTAPSNVVATLIGGDPMTAPSRG